MWGYCWVEDGNTIKIRQREGGCHRRWLENCERNPRPTLEQEVKESFARQEKEQADNLKLHSKHSPSSFQEKW